MGQGIERLREDGRREKTREKKDEPTCGKKTQPREKKCCSVSESVGGKDASTLVVYSKASKRKGEGRTEEQNAPPSTIHPPLSTNSFTSSSARTRPISD
jgi:hypothetical protein